MSPSDADWALYAAHRAHFTAALLASGRARGGRLCVLGAGACNDLELAQLGEHFSELHLVDLDEKALALAAARQSPALRARLHLHAPVNLSGLPAKRLRLWRRHPPAVEQLKVVAERAREELLKKLPGPFDVVASACVLTQMSFHLRGAVGAQHPMLEALRLTLMGHHLNTLVGLMAEHGTLLFVSDLVSSSFYPLEKLPPERPLRDVMREVVDAGASYFAAQPELIATLLRQVGEPELLDPWLWTGPQARTYLVYALRLSRS